MGMTKKQGGEAPAHGQMDQVRELLFGAQWKELEVKFSRFEEQYQRELQGMQEAFKHRMESLDNFMRSEVNTLLHRIKEEEEDRGRALKDEQIARDDAIKVERREREESFKVAEKDRLESVAVLNKEIASALELIERKSTKLANTLDTTERELRQLLLTEFNGLNDKVEQKYIEAIEVLSSSAKQIRSDMVYRSSLSTLLTEMALKISGQWGSVLDGADLGQSDVDTDESEAESD